MRMKSWMVCLNLLLAVAVAAGCSKQENSVIRVKGSTTVDPITRKLAAAFQAKRDIRIEVNSAGSHSGLEALIGGQCDIAESSSEAAPEYVKKAAKAGVALKAFLIAHDHILPIVHPSNPVERLSLKQLSDIYDGRTTSWETITDQKGDIVVVGRNEASGTGDIWKAALGIEKEITSMVVQPSNSGVLAFVAGNKNALGYISAAFLNIEVKPLKVSETSPEVQDKSAPHPIYRSLYLYVDENRFTEEARSFIVFILSAEGQKLISQLGFRSVTEN